MIEEEWAVRNVLRGNKEGDALAVVMIGGRLTWIGDAPTSRDNGKLLLIHRSFAWLGLSISVSSTCSMRA
jgi:hypothetical protein